MQKPCVVAVVGGGGGEEGGTPADDQQAAAAVLNNSQDTRSSPSEDHHHRQCPATGTLSLFKIRSKPRKFGISFVVPDRVAAEISDGRRIRGKHPMRILRVPRGLEFHRMVEEARQNSPPMSTRERERCPLVNPHKAYHRALFNDWHPQLLYHHHYNAAFPPPTTTTTATTITTTAAAGTTTCVLCSSK